MTEQQLDPGHTRTRGVLCTLGPILIVVALGLIGLGIVGIFVVGPISVLFGFVAIPLLFIGSVMTMFGFMGRVARYQAGEVAPVATDTFNYMAEGTQQGVETMAGALGRGLSAGGLGGVGAMVRCHKCNALLPADAKFCSQCGQAAGKTKPCPRCRELNDPDARFCDNCGHEYA